MKGYILKVWIWGYLIPKNSYLKKKIPKPIHNFNQNKSIFPSSLEVSLLVTNAKTKQVIPHGQKQHFTENSPLLIQHILQSILPPSVLLPMYLYILTLSCQLPRKLRRFYAILPELNIKEILWTQFHGLFMKHTITINTLWNCPQKTHS